MFSKDGSVAIVFNGEIYNYQDLRVDLESLGCFDSNSDTEVLLNMYLVYGVEMLVGLTVFSLLLFGMNSRIIYSWLVTRWVSNRCIFTLLNRAFFFKRTKGYLCASDVSTLDHYALDRYLTYLGVPGIKPLIRKYVNCPLVKQ